MTTAVASDHQGAEAKATRLLAGGRVHVIAAGEFQTTARVQGDSGLWDVAWSRDEGWRCSCPAWGYRCSHVLAVRMVTAGAIPRAPGAPSTSHPTGAHGPTPPPLQPKLALVPSAAEAEQTAESRIAESLERADREWASYVERWMLHQPGTWLAEEATIAAARAGHTTRNARATGGIVRALNRAGRIRTTGEFRPARTSHSSLKAVWSTVDPLPGQVT